MMLDLCINNGYGYHTGYLCVLFANIAGLLQI